MLSRQLEIKNSAPWMEVKDRDKFVNYSSLGSDEIVKGEQDRKGTIKMETREAKKETKTKTKTQKVAGRGRESESWRKPAHRDSGKVQPRGDRRTWRALSGDSHK